jgi:hypothetical protein
MAFSNCFPTSLGDATMSQVWASTNYTEAYDVKESCLKKYLGSVTKQKIKDGDHILMEVMADLDGLATAYKVK